LSIIFTCYFQHNEALQCTFENNTFWKVEYQIEIKHYSSNVWKTYTKI
jgi:hypothetical protein